MLRLAKVSKTFNENTPSEVRALKEVTITIETGSFVTIIGSNGSGKTTLLNVIAGIFPNEGGAIYLSGKPISSVPRYIRSRKISKVNQDAITNISNSFRKTYEAFFKKDFKLLRENATETADLHFNLSYNELSKSKGENSVILHYIIEGLWIISIINRLTIPVFEF